MPKKRRKNRRRGGQTRRENRKANKQAKRSLNKGQNLAEKLAPDLFNEGLDRVDFDDYNKFLTPSLNEANQFKDTVTKDFGELMNLRRARLGGLNSAEMTAHKEGLFRDIDRGRAAGARQLAQDRARGLGSGAAFGQRRALNRDYEDSAGQARRQLLLDNYSIKGQALNDFQNTVGGKQAALAGANETLTGIRGAQLAAKSGTDQFNADQQKTEMGAKIGAISTGTGLYKDERDRIEAQRKQQELLKFLKERDDAKFSQLQGLL